MDRRTLLAGMSVVGVGVFPRLALHATAGRQPMQTFDYLEFTTTDLEATKAFYMAAFGFEFTDYGPEYAAVHGGDLEIGIRVSDAAEPPLPGFQTDDITASEHAVRDGGGMITRETYPFPGGRRFHFHDPAGNELIVYQADA
jgi:predicted enzyme related to lactoylglutathione lyase